MTPEAVRRYGRQLALADFGPEAQAAVLEARVVVAGTGIIAETVARYLVAAGVGWLRLDAAAWEIPGLVAALAASQPGVRLEELPSESGEGDAFSRALEGATLLVRTVFDDDPWLAAAVRAGVPAIFAQTSDERIDLLSIRRQGPCPHVPTDWPRARARGVASSLAASLAVTAGTLAATEALRLIGARGRGDESHAAARMFRLDLGGAPPLAQDIPWSPACFACGGQGREMSFS